MVDQITARKKATPRELHEALSIVRRLSPSRRALAVAAARMLLREAQRDGHPRPRPSNRRREARS